MANKSTSAHASRKSKMGKVKGMRISLVGNGAKSMLQHEPPADGPMGMMGGMGGSVDGDEMIHPSMAHLVKHVKASMGPHMAATTGSGGGGSVPAPAGQQPDTAGPDVDDDDDE